MMEGSETGSVPKGCSTMRPEATVPVVQEEVQISRSDQEIKAQPSRRDEVSATGEEVLADPSDGNPLTAEESASVQIAACGSKVVTCDPLPAPETKPESGDIDSGCEKEPTPEPTAVTVAATVVALGQQQHGSSVVQGGSPLMPREAFSDMPPPSFLPRPLRTKRNSCGVSKTANISPSQITTNAKTSGATNASTCPAVGVAGRLGETQPVKEGGRLDETQTVKEGKQPEGQTGSPSVTSTVSGDAGTVDEEFVLFMKEIEQLDSQREAETSANTESLSDVAAAPTPQDQQATVHTLPSSECSQDKPPELGAFQSPQLQPQRAAWQAVEDASSGRTYYWNVSTDEVTWEMPKGYSDLKTAEEASKELQQQELQQWAASTFKKTQELQTCAEKIQQFIMQLDFMEDELDSVYEYSPSTKAVPASEDLNISSRLQLFRSLKRQREQQRQKRSQESKASFSDDELLKDLIDLQLQQEKQQNGARQCTLCRSRIAESRGTQPQQAKIRTLASTLARRLGNVEKEWAAAMLAALKARLDDWIDGGLSGSFFLQRLDTMQQELQKHLSQDLDAEGRQQELASAFPYSAAAAVVSANTANKTLPRNSLASAGASAKNASLRLSSTSRSVGSAASCANVPSGDPPVACVAPPTPSGPPPTLPDEVLPAAADAAQAEAAAATADLPRHRDAGAAAAASRDGAQALGAFGGTGKRASSSTGTKRLTSSNPLVRKRMQLVERWQRSREKGEDCEEEDYEQRRERQKQRKLDEWKEREMASQRGMNNANFIEVTADWRSLVGKK